MKPILRYHSTILSIVITIMYAVFASAPAIRSYVGNVPKALEIISGLVFSVGLYKLASSLLNTSMVHCSDIKKLIFGNEYMHGTWIGCFIGNNGDKRIYVEHFEQDLESLMIRGTGYTESGEFFVQWQSEPGTIEPRKGRLVYTYTSDVIFKTETRQGLGVFQFVRDNINKPPVELKGYIVDIDQGKRLKSEETKISDDLLLPNVALEKAMSRFS